MPANLERQVRKKIADFVTNKIGLDSFYDWLAPHIWEAANGKYSANLKKLLSKLSLYLSEYSAKLYPIEKLKSKLAAFV